MASKRAPQERAVTWHGTGDPLAPYEADVDGETWLVSVNDFPDEPMYTLFVDDREIESFDNWPSTWRRPSFASQFGEKLASLLRPRAGAPAAAGKPVPVPKQEPVPVPAWAWPTDSSRLRVRYQYGNEHSPTDPIGRVVVDLQTSSVRLDNWRRSLGGHHAWQARVAPAVMDKIVSFLVDGGFPRPLYATQRGFPPDTTFRTLELTDDGQKAAVFMAWDDAAKNPAYGMVFKLLDAMVGELTGGRIPSPPVRESPLVRNVEPIALDPEANPTQQHHTTLL